MALEIRWFFEGVIPPEVAAWFQAAAPVGTSPPPERRTDTYLVTRDEGFGVKLREGKLEIKWRRGYGHFSGGGGRVTGKVEDWVKWGWADHEAKSDKEILQALEGGESPWVPVKKERGQRMCELTGDGLTFPGKGRRLVSGCALELTMLDIRERSWWTLGLDIFANEGGGDKVLEKCIDGLFGGYPGPALRVENSYGYPEWLSMVGK